MRLRYSEQRVHESGCEVVMNFFSNSVKIHVATQKPVYVI